MARLTDARVDRMVAKGYVTLADAARASSYHDSVLRRHYEKGRVKGCRFGSAYFIEWASLLAYVGAEAARLAELPTTAAEAYARGRRVAQRPGA